jgi:ubiquinone/menaquinone biosynthesis C-methylase UbiE
MAAARKAHPSLHVRAGDHVADLGSGSGYFTFRLAKAVGPNGKVYAVDIDEEMSNLITKRAQKEGTAQRSSGDYRFQPQSLVSRIVEPLHPG